MLRFLMGGVASAMLFWGHGVTAQVKELHKDCSTLSAPGHYPDYEPTPEYSVQRRERAADNTLILQISVSPAAALRETALVRLACKLGTDNATQNKVMALIFDDKKAARNSAAGFTDQRNNGIYLWHLRANYTLDRSARIEYVEFVLPEFEANLPALWKLKVILSR